MVIAFLTETGKIKRNRKEKGINMDVVKKYWNSVYIYVLLLIPGFCMCAGIFWTICKMSGLYQELSWNNIIIFDLSQSIYLGIAIYFIYQNYKDNKYISSHLIQLKIYIFIILFVQYNLILNFFPSIHVWECTFLFFAAFVFFFDCKLMLVTISAYFVSLVAAHLHYPGRFLPLRDAALVEVIAFRLVLFLLTSICIIAIVYFVERFLIQEKEEREDNMHLLEKQLENYKNTELLDMELRKFRHDIRNHFTCMEALLREGNRERLQNYFESLQNDFAVQDKLYLSGNDIVDAVLNYDLPHFCREDVTVTVYGHLPKLKTVSDLDLCTLFSNLLSNAINAANQYCTTGTAQLIVHFQTGTQYLCIAISNSIDKDYAGIFSQRKKQQDRNHGFGIQKIKEILNKYQGTIEENKMEEIVTINVYLPI